MKTNEPLIMTARIFKKDLTTYDRLRRIHFPPERNFLTAHVTMFHRLPGEHLDQVIDLARSVAVRHSPMVAEVSGIRLLGAGVAYEINSLELSAIHVELKATYAQWLGGQDQQKWKPHITIQNNVDKHVADALHRRLSQEFEPTSLTISGLDIWRYLGGPWHHEQTLFIGIGTSQEAYFDH